MLRLVLAALAFSFAFTAPAQADPNLIGFNNKKILIQEGYVDYKKCGVTRQRLETALRFILQQSKYQIGGDVPGYLYLNANVLHGNGHCLYSVEISAHAGVQIVDSKRFGVASLWSMSGLGVTPERESQKIYDLVEAVAKQFVVAWSQANP